MKRHFLTVAGLLMASAGLQAQMDKTTGASFQVFASDGGTIKTFVTEQLNGPTVTGKPFSGTEERHSVQVLGDGTRIDKTETDRLFRDDQGRTRTERPDGTVIVHDPILGITTESNTNNKNARRMTVQSKSKTTLDDVLKSEIAKIAAEQTARAAVKGEIMKKTVKVYASGAQTATPIEENLGPASVNGVVAQGTRQTTTIEAGQIGNDRPIRIVSERWYSNELQMLVKSSNSDPRFGETTYQLMNVSMAAPDAALFQIPAEHKIGGQ